tara:strand:- start:3874 stop:4041 length:168 start_codon:yes stop_codon:yes gene_type:complete
MIFTGFESKSDFIEKVRDKYGNSKKSYSITIKSNTKEEKKGIVTEKKSKRYDSKK